MPKQKTKTFELVGGPLDGLRIELLKAEGVLRFSIGPADGRHFLVSAQWHNPFHRYVFWHEDRYTYDGIACGPE